MIVSEILPILILVLIAVLAITFIVIQGIRSQKSLILDSDSDIFDELVDKKKRQINANLGGLSWRNYVLLMVICPIALAGIGFVLLDNKSVCIVLAFVGILIPEIILRITAKQQKKKFEENYAMALRALASGLRSGLTIEQAIDNVGRNPFLEVGIRDGFKQIATDIKFGIPMDEAFQNFANDSESQDAQDVANALSMQAKVGGSEAAVITTIVQNINDRIMMRNEIQALFASTNMLVTVMDFMPIVLVGMLYFGAYDLLEPYFESPSMTMVLVGLLAFSVAGSLIIHKMANSAKGR